MFPVLTKLCNVLKEWPITKMFCNDLLFSPALLWNRNFSIGLLSTNPCISTSRVLQWYQRQGAVKCPSLLLASAGVESRLDILADAGHCCSKAPDLSVLLWVLGSILCKPKNSNARGNAMICHSGHPRHIEIPWANLLALHAITFRYISLTHQPTPGWFSKVKKFFCRRQST